ncbi:AAA family ATPase [Methylocystis parvus]|uniref:AAA family ATPase n=1 Tax=Methylocystis parvus TaxID=134 RepID=UPI003C76308C
MTHISRTTALVSVEQCFNYALERCEAAAVFGTPGVGKTTAMTHLAERSPTATLIHVGSTRCTPRAIASMIADAMRLWVEHRSAWQITEIIEAHLMHPSTRDEILMFDEAQNIPLGFLKDIVDWPQRFGVPVLICGNEHLLKRTKASGAAFDQIDSRIGKRIHLSRPTREDFETIAIDFDVFGVDARNACAAYGAKNSIRDLISLLQTARDFAEGRKLGLEEIRKAVVYKKGTAGLKQLSNRGA